MGEILAEGEGLGKAERGRHRSLGLLDLRATAEPALRDRVLALDDEIAGLDHTIAEREAAMNALVYRLYQLAPEEIAMVEAG